MALSLEFCSEWYRIDPHDPFLIGREGPLEIVDNQYLHRRFLVISFQDGLWWIDNIGSRLSATLADHDGATQAYLQPGARLPIVYSETTVLFTAGPTTYEMRLINDEPAYMTSNVVEKTPDGQTTIGPIQLGGSQELLVLALSEPLLKARGGASSIPSAHSAAARLGWTSIYFNQTLERLCERLTKYGVRGLHGGATRLSANRRARLVEHAVATRLVTVDELYKLDNPARYEDSQY